MKHTTVYRSFATLLVGAGLVAACASPPPPPEPTAAPATATAAPEEETAQALGMPTPLPRTREGGIVANARVMPTTSLEIFSPIAQLVSEVLVEEGDTVKEGDSLLRFDTGRLELSLREVEALLREERANYEFLRSSATPEQIQAASAQVERARAQLRQAELAVTPQDVAAAEASLADALAQLALLRKGPTDDDIAVKQAAVDNAKAHLQSTRDTTSVEKNQAQAALEKAANKLREAQAFYEKVYWRNRDIEKGGTLAPAELQDEQNAQIAVDNAQLDVNVAQLAYEEARKTEIEAIKADEAMVRQAEAQLNMLFEAADPNAIMAAQKAVDEARIRLAELKGGRYNSELDEARANVAYNEALLQQLDSEPNTSSLARAEARIARAEVEVEKAKLALDQAVLRTPISGQVTRVNVFPNTYVQTENVAFVVADLSTWNVQIDEVNEIDVVSIREGDLARISFIALPGFELSGTVSRIEPIGQRTERQAGARYRVIINPDGWDDRLRWNMSATVAIVPQQ